jgi:hypothetical protein
VAGTGPGDAGPGAEGRVGFVVADRVVAVVRWDRGPGRKPSVLYDRVQPPPFG